MTSKKPLLTKPSEIVDEPWVRVEMAGLPACDDILGLCAGVVADGLDNSARAEHLSRADLLLDILGQLHPDHIDVLGGPLL